MVDLLPEILSAFFEGAIDSEVMEAKDPLELALKQTKTGKVS